MRFIKRSILFITPFLLGSCFSSSIMQTAKPTEVGTLEGSVGLSGYVDDGNVYPGVDGMIRTGVSAKSDVGLAYSNGTLGHLKLDFKHQLYASPDQNAYLSSGIGVDGIWSEEILGPTNKDIGITLPLYFSFNHNKNVTPYFAQRATLGLTGISALSQYSKDPGLEVYDLNHDWYYSGGGGIRWGKKKMKWFAELSYVFQFNRRYTNDVFTNDQGVLDSFSFKSVGKTGTTQVTVGVIFGK